MQRASGVLMHVSTLFGDYSEGAFGKNAKKFVDFLADCGFSYWQVLPFCLPDDYNSPYKSYSAFSVNPNFIDLETLREKGLISPEDLRSSKQNSPWLCEFDRLKNERIKVLSRAAKNCTENGKIKDFVSKNPLIDEFCKFMAIKKNNGQKAWTEWSDLTPDEDEYQTWCFVCHEFMEEWQIVRDHAASRKIKIIGDVPIYVAHDSADVYFHRENFLLDGDGNPSLQAGVPPDYFCADGQLWGNPVYDWAQMEKDGFSWWKERMKFTCKLFDGVRIDHFRGIESYYAVPQGEKTARNGKWHKGPGEKLISAIKEVAADKLIIAEDLGDVTPAVCELVKKSGFPGMRVLQFAFLGDEKTPHLPHNYENNCVAYTGTHDNNTLLGYVWEQNQGERARMLEYFGYRDPDWNKCYDTVIRGMFSSSAGLVIFPIQDLLGFGSDTRFNTPGIGSKNWAFRITEEQLNGVDRAKYRRLNELYGRKPD